MAEESVAVGTTNTRPLLVFMAELAKAKLPATVTATPE